MYIYSLHFYAAGLLLIMLIVLLPETLRKSPPSTNSELYNGKERFVALKTMRNVFTPMVMMVRDPTVVLITLYNTVIYASLFFLVSIHISIISMGLTSICTESIHDRHISICLSFRDMASGSLLSLSRYWPCYKLDFEWHVLGSHYQEAAQVEGPWKRRSRNEIVGCKTFILLDSRRVLDLRVDKSKRSWCICSFDWYLCLYVELILYCTALAIHSTNLLLFVNTLDALGQMNSLNPTNVYLVDSKPGKSASAMAINNLRSVAAAIVTIFSTSIVRAAGPGVVFSILAGISVLNCIPVLLVQRFGKQWRTSFEQKTGFLSPTNNSSAKANAVVREDDDNV